MGYSFRLTARVLLLAPSDRQHSTYHGLCYTSRGALLAGTRNSSMGPPDEGSIRRPIAPWANALTERPYRTPLPNALTERPYRTPLPIRPYRTPLPYALTNTPLPNALTERPYRGATSRSGKKKPKKITNTKQRPSIAAPLSRAVVFRTSGSRKQCTRSATISSEARRARLKVKHIRDKTGRKKFYLTTHWTHFENVYGYMREREKYFIQRRTQHILFTVIWRQTYG